MKKRLMMLVAVLTALVLPGMASALELDFYDTDMVKSIDPFFSRITEENPNGEIGVNITLKEEFDLKYSYVTYYAVTKAMTEEKDQETELFMEAQKDFYYSSESEDDSHEPVKAVGIIPANTSFYQSITSDKLDYNVDYVVEITLLRADKSGEVVSFNYCDSLDPEMAYIKVKKLEADPNYKPEEETVTKVDKSALDEIKTSGKKSTIETKVDGKVLYAWIFDGSKMKTTDLDIDLTVELAKENKTITLPENTTNSLFVNFTYHGNLPEGTSVRVDASSVFKNGKKVALYYYNEETKKLEEVATNLEVKDGYVEFALEHCSSYVLVELGAEVVEEDEENPQTSSMNLVLYVTITLISLAAIILIKKIA